MLTSYLCDWIWCMRKKIIHITWKLGLKQHKGSPSNKMHIDKPFVIWFRRQTILKSYHTIICVFDLYTSPLYQGTTRRESNSTGIPIASKRRKKQQETGEKTDFVVDMIFFCIDSSYQEELLSTIWYDSQTHDLPNYGY